MSLFFPTTAEFGRHTIFPGVTIQTCAADKMLMAYVDLEPHSVVAEHSHPHEQVGMVLQGRLVFTIGGADGTFGRGMQWQGLSLRMTLQHEPTPWIPSSFMPTLAGRLFYLNELAESLIADCH